MSWLRRNAVGLLASAALLPTVGWLSFSDGWREYQQSLPLEAVVAEHGRSGEFAGARWSVTDVDRDAAAVLDTPPPDGTDLVVVSYRVETSGDSTRLDGCRIMMRHDARTWQQPGAGEVSWSPAEGYQVGCTPAAGVGTADGQAAFLLPGDQVEEILAGGEIMIVLYPELPRYLSLRL